MTLADEDTNAIPTDTANKAIQGNVKSNIGQWTAFSNTTLTFEALFIENNSLI